MNTILRDFGHVPLCNHRADRGIFIGSFCLPLCARCTGIVCGAAGGMLGMWLLQIHMSLKMLLLAGIFLMIPTAIDGIRQYRFGIESTNRRRLLTGILCGVGCAFMDHVIFYGIL